ncbi:winged helix-turn-helix transcriptional regulator [Flavobacterium pectinovorum]|uniref:winged helix-turn-helix transcriptional regulator n=1 Tax=Flavobacterium pectinovorum TaxID=29533 RepID=UPI001FAE593E|nr:helix-turn-helix domain-containing protein [Flavobacterium pectinovorum]MCI9845560.1 helix-turn-helix transcriptional regulator [Flavobacterium pectinovorum]
MTKIIDLNDECCPVKKALALLGGKWTLLILFQINHSKIRYGELRRAIPGISEKMLLQELNFLVSNNLVSKKSYPEKPPRVEYTLTPLGLKVLPIIEIIDLFGRENLKSHNNFLIKSAEE